MPSATHTDLSPELLEHMKAIKAKAVQYGLDFFEVVFEVPGPISLGLFVALLAASFSAGSRGCSAGTFACAD